MNRLGHLQQTLAANLADNQDYPNLEFILLDYNSSDGLGEWVNEHMQTCLANGRLLYYKTISPVHFQRAHSKNLAHKLANGDIVCNIDADNFTGQGFAAYVNGEFQKDDNIFLTAIDTAGPKQKGDVLGRICVKKSDFHKIGGYDERMSNYGFEDYDLANRLSLINVTRKILKNDPVYFKTISHSQAERLGNEAIAVNFYMLLVRYVTPFSSDFVLLFNDGQYKRGMVVDSETYPFVEPLTDSRQAEMHYRMSLEDSWAEGRWQGNESEINILIDGAASEQLLFDPNQNAFVSYDTNEGSTFYRIIDRHFIEHFMMFYSQFVNRRIMARNKLEKRAVVNELGFGKDVIYKNFDYLTPIFV